MRALLIVLLAAAGLALGPLLRAVVVALSVPPGHPEAARPQRRKCPGCGVPLVRALPPPRLLAGLPPQLLARLLPGRCANCGTRLGPPPLTVEVTAGALLGLLGAAVHPGLVLAALCLLAVCAIPLAFVSLVVFLAAAAAATNGGDWSRLGRALLGGLAFAGFCLVLFVISPGGMGPGDVLTELRPRVGQGAPRHRVWLFCQFRGRVRCLRVPQFWSWMCSSTTVGSVSVEVHRWTGRGRGMSQGWWCPGSGRL
jgi:leader peptidase (prepilin peptidase)/N-methyltransferase